MKKLLQIFATAFGVAVLATPALAQLSVNASVTNNYVFRGISQSAKDPAIAGGIDYSFANGLALGAWASSIDFGDDSSMELDLYGSYNFMVGAAAASVGVYGYIYPDSGSGGPYDYAEIFGSISYSFGPVAWSAKAYWAPSLPKGFLTIREGNNPDQEYWLTTGLSIPVADFLSISGNIGYEGYSGLPSGATDDSYFEYDIGATATWNILSLDLRYVDTDIHTFASYTADPFATGGFFVATLTVKYTFP